METAGSNTSNFVAGHILLGGTRQSWTESTLLSLLDISSWTLMNQGALVVVLDMSLAVCSIFFNIMVITAIKEKEEMLGNTFNLVLVNLCSSNLLGAVMVKSISIVHNGYAVAAHVLQSDIAFCLLYTFSYRLTWAVLPWSIVLCCWLSLIPRIKRLQVSVLLSYCPWMVNATEAVITYSILHSAITNIRQCPSKNATKGAMTNSVLGKPSNEKNGNSLVLYQTGGGGGRGRYPRTKLFPVFSHTIYIALK